MTKKIGIIGGMSAESTIEYYQYITRTYIERHHNYNYPEVIIYSVSFQDYVDWPNNDRWDLVAEGLANAAQNLQRAGADFALIATNTMHLVFDEIQQRTSLPLLSLLDTVGDAIQKQGLTTVGLLGTRFTMEKDFYPRSLAKKGISVIVPDKKDSALVNRVIYNELVAGQFLAESRQAYVEIINRMIARGAQGIILGCTEIPLLIRPSDSNIPLFDTTHIHAEAALNRALQ